MKDILKSITLDFAIVFGNILLAKDTLKSIMLDFAIVLGNILLAKGLFEACIYFVRIFPELSDQLALVIFGVLQIAINILLYKTFLKKFFKPAEEKSPGFCFLLTLIPCVIWIAMFWILFFFAYDFNVESYIGVLISFLPLFLGTLIPTAIAYFKFFYKRVGEAYLVYMLSILYVAFIPITVLSIIPVL